MTTQDYSYKGRGSVLLGLADGGPLLPIGNTEELSIAIDSETDELEDFESPSGGIAASSTWIKKTTMSMTIRNLSPENMAKAYLGSAEAVTSGSVTNEEHKAYKGGYIIFKHIKPTSVVVKSADGNTTYAENTDYTVTPSGILIKTNGGIDDGDTIKVNYSHGAENVIEAMTSSAKEYKIVYLGANTARDGRERRVTMHRVRLSPAAEVSLVTSNWGELKLTGTLIKDASQPNGKSQYFQDIFEPAP